ncbi:MAG: DUF192 domain-containing protein [Chloroflexia bacterium]|nr:DUF192 domain-containing protein [Chloroflexia bacterium]
MKRPYRTIVIVFLMLIGLLAPAGATVQREQLPPWREPLPAARPMAEITVGDVSVTVELALSDDDQALGLGFRNGLEPDRGMLFVFEEPAERSFWMRGMRFCIDIIWIANGDIVGAAEGACPDPEGTDDADREHYLSGEPVTHVLEMPAGWMADNGFGPGTPVEIPEPLG